jgi:hypothetical protein
VLASLCSSTVSRQPEICKRLEKEQDFFSAEEPDEAFLSERPAWWRWLGPDERFRFRSDRRDALFWTIEARDRRRFGENSGNARQQTVMDIIGVGLHDSAGCYKQPSILGQAECSAFRQALPMAVRTIGVGIPHDARRIEDPVDVEQNDRFHQRGLSPVCRVGDRRSQRHRTAPPLWRTPPVIGWLVYRYRALS